MRPETAIVEIHNQYRVYTEHYRNTAADKTIILVNGSLATTASFAQTLRYLRPHFNVVLYDQPYAGQSRLHNRHDQPLRKEDEAEILLQLIEHFAAAHVLSFSWGGAATLLALAQRPRRIEKAVIASFSARINQPMHDYLHSGLGYLQACDRERIGRLINDCIGKHLPPLFKRFNYRHVSTLAEHEYQQMYWHVHEVLSQNTQGYLNCAAAIDIPLLFINGEKDEYTTPADARLFGGYAAQCQFRTIKNSGHFLDMEHQAAWHDSRHSLLDFLRPSSWLNQLDDQQPKDNEYRYTANACLVT